MRILKPLRVMLAAIAGLVLALGVTSPASADHPGNTQFFVDDYWTCGYTWTGGVLSWTTHTEVNVSGMIDTAPLPPGYNCPAVYVPAPQIEFTAYAGDAIVDSHIERPYYQHPWAYTFTLDQSWTGPGIPRLRPIDRVVVQFCEDDTDPLSHGACSAEWSFPIPSPPVGTS